MFFSAIFGFFLCFFIIGTQLIKENEKEKHDHKTCQKCVCEKNVIAHTKKNHAKLNVYAINYLGR